MNDCYRRLAGNVDAKKELILDAAAYIWDNPELGYKEWKTGGYLKEQFANLGYDVREAGDIPGFIADLDTGRPGPKVAIMGELDAVMCATHPSANKETHAVHACGHLVQVTAMLGAAAVLKESPLRQEMAGSVRFMAVPAEETIDLAYRNGLIERGVIKYVAGKIEFLRRGFFDGVDMAVMFHADTEPEKLFTFIDGYDGCIVKHMEYKGVAAHAGGAPHKGINALYAASLGLQACNALRETFEEKDYVRYHPVITSAGHAANVIPAEAKLDTYVRAAAYEKMIAVNAKINRALAASAAALGANVTVEDRHGNFPFTSDKVLSAVCRDVIGELFGKDVIRYGGWDTQSSDVGDISSIMPVLQPLCAGAAGTQHGENYEIADKEKCIVNPTKVLACMAYELLREGAKKAWEVKNAYRPLFESRDEYFIAIDDIEMKKSLVCYNQDGTITLEAGK